MKFRALVLPLFAFGLLAFSSCAGTDTLHRAAQYGDLAAVQRHLSDSADVNARNDEGYTPLMMAVLSDQVEIARLLLTRGADVNIQTLQGKRMTFSLSGRKWIAKDPMRTRRGSILVGNTMVVGKGYSVLTMASLVGDVEMTQTIIVAGASVDWEAELGITPLFIAAGEGHTPVVKALLSAGADVNHTDYFGRTPLTVAVNKSKKETVTQARLRFEKLAANIPSVIPDENIDVVKVLLAAKANPNARVKKGYDLPEGGGYLVGDTALSIAKRRGYAETVKLLEQAGAVE